MKIRSTEDLLEQAKEAGHTVPRNFDKQLMVSGEYCEVGTAMTNFVEVSWSTLKSAIERNEIATVRLACGTKLVKVNDLKQWVQGASTRRRGRKTRDTSDE